MNPENVERIENTITNNWHKPIGLILACLLGVYLILHIPILSSFTPRDITLICTLFILFVSVIWYIDKPRVKKEKFGIGVAICFEDSDYSKKAYLDLIHRLQDAFSDFEIKNNLSFIPYNKHISNEVQTDKDALRLCKDMNLRFLLYGKIKNREINNDQSDVYEIKFVATHAPIPVEYSSKFGENLTKALGKSTIIPSKDSYLLSQTLSKNIEAVINYAIGLIYCFSKNFDMGELHLNKALDLAAHIHNDKSDQKSLENKYFLHECIKKQLHSMHLELAMFNYEIVRNNPGNCADIKFQEHLEKTKKFLIVDDRESILSAINCFKTNRDIEECYRELNRCKNKNTKAWYCNIAFLKAYEHNLDECHNYYKKAIRAIDTDPTIWSQCENFITEIIETEHRHIGLLFCLCVINYKAKQDIESASRDFKVFLKHPNINKFHKHRDIVLNWQNEINNMATKRAG